MESLMLKIENNAKMTAAVARCKAHHPRVRRVASDRVAVTGSKGAAYVVTFATPREGLRLASCDCAAGQSGQLCYHVAAALACPVQASAPVVIVRPRRA